MKGKLLYIACLVITGLLQSCTNEVDDLFDTPAQQRMNEELMACKTLLTSSELGWKLDYYPSSVQSYGGYAMTLKFTDTQVTAASEITGDPAKTVKSLYSLKADMGPTLNFDSYNEILHYFADPDNSEGAGLGKGYEGDYEFIIQSHSEDEIILKGKKTKNLMKMTRLAEPSETYLAAILKLEEQVSAVVGILGYSGTVNGENVSISLPSDRRMSIQFGNSLESTGFMYTATGIKFYQPITIGGQEVSSLEWSESSETFMSGNNLLTPVPDPVYPKYLSFLGEYTMNYFSGSQAREITIKLLPLAYTASTKAYMVEGLPFPLQMYYNPTLDCLEIISYTTDAYYVAVWEVSGDGYLNWGGGIGLIGKLKKDTDNVYEFVDNGVWSTSIARAIILWSPSGEYKEFGGDTRFQDIVFTKK